MFNLNIIAVGNIKESYLKLGIEEFMKRLSSYIHLSIREIDEAQVKIPSHETLIEKALMVDANKIIQLIPKQTYLVVMDLNGQMMKSENLAKKIEQIQNHSGSLTMIIGGSHGLHPSIKKIAKESWSFSSLTFPHQLFRLLLLEQIYRSMTILKGHPYHK
jgi:23S rRNA (pseudouridine1915-N3)-methyltransferase